MFDLLEFVFGFQVCDDCTTFLLLYIKANPAVTKPIFIVPAGFISNF